jgi:hypothetical protein
MAEVYDAAGLRHYRDGELLSDSLRIANADQLYGFAAECAIKRALVSLPGCANSGILASKYREHVERLWDLAQVQGIQKRYPKLMTVLKNLRHPFADWSTNQRYERDDVVTEDALRRHRRAAARVLGSVGLSGTRGEA